MRQLSASRPFAASVGLADMNIAADTAHKIEIQPSPSVTPCHGGVGASLSLCVAPSQGKQLEGGRVLVVAAFRLLIRAGELLAQLDPPARLELPLLDPKMPCEFRLVGSDSDPSSLTCQRPGDAQRATRKGGPTRGVQRATIDETLAHERGEAMTKFIVLFFAAIAATAAAVAFFGRKRAADALDSARDTASSWGQTASSRATSWGESASSTATSVGETTSSTASSVGEVAAKKAEEVASSVAEAADRASSAVARKGKEAADKAQDAAANAKDLG
jgi:hypothetical protein